MLKLFKGTGLYRNAISYFGIIIIFISSALILATLLWSYSLRAPSPYLGIFTFLIFPAFLFFGILLFIFGIIWEGRRRKKYKKEALPYPVLDLNNPVHRKKFGFFAVSGIFIFILLAFVGYNGFIFTESVTFCGKVCHKVMKPEYSAYLRSPHARVSCVDCHVGEGVSWYAKSKLSGLRQVWAVIFNTYEKPIPTPIENLRPARETCEKCHWPQKFYGAQLMQIPHFRYDKNNTAEEISLIIKTGGGTRIEKNAGIHWHMLLQNKVYFKAKDRRFQIIPYIEAVKEDGKKTVYRDASIKISPEELEKLPLHQMDCMDCHNRPTHIFQPPERAVDMALAGGHISRELPFIKKLSVDLLTEGYISSEEAVENIRTRMLDFYEKNYPEIFSEEKEKIENAARVLLEIYQSNVFPEMKVDWNTYPLNIGHRNWPGCFRCHDGRHISEDGKVLTTECILCHTAPQRGKLSELGAKPLISDLPWHPMELKGKHLRTLCNNCHKAGFRAPLDCAECHKLNREETMISMGCGICHLEEGSREPFKDCKNCHVDLKELHTRGGHPDVECKDCHKAHIWKVDGMKDCYSCHIGYEKHSEGKNCLSCHSFKK